MKKSKYLRLLTICLAVVLLVCSLSGCVSNKESDSKTSGQSESGTFENGETSGNNLNSADGEELVLSDELSYSFEFLNAENNTWESVEESELAIFGSDEFEPGYKKYVYFRIKNTSKIDFDWELGFEDCTGNLKLGDVIYVFTNFGDEILNEYPDRSDEVEGYWARGTLSDLLSYDGAFHSSELNSGKSVYFGILLEMNESAGREYNGLKLDNVALELTVAERLLFATCTDENDSDGFQIAVDNSGKDFEDVLPGDILDMSPSVRNTGMYKQYVRVTVTVSDVEAFRQDMGAEWSAESLFKKPAWTDDSTMVLDSVSIKDDCAVLVFYLNKLLAPGESIVLYEGVSMPSELTANTFGTTSLKDGFTVKVFAEAVFTSNTAIEDAKSAFEYAASKQ